jgi:hypothetical protein
LQGIEARRAKDFFYDLVVVGARRKQLGTEVGAFQQSA